MNPLQSVDHALLAFDCLRANRPDLIEVAATPGPQPLAQFL